ncbi:MAG: NADPH-dependent F420 reductase [SAR324 cluster bacterium]|nr:NADPH-dependent F420 reductase [SAR324 cluster bacterium]
MSDPTVGIIGGTGPQGRGLAMRFAMTGLPVIVGSRQDGKARDIAEGLNGALEKHGRPFHAIEGLENRAMAGKADYVFLTVPFENAERTVEGLSGAFRQGAVFVDVTVPLRFGKGDVQLEVPPEGSASRQLRKILHPSIPLCGAGKTLPAHVLEEISIPLDCDTFVFGDDKAAKGGLMELMARIPGLRPLDVGGLSAALTVEGMTALLIRLNRRYKSRLGRFGVVGLGA